MDFKKLFQRNTNGSVQEWQIFVEDNFYYTISGKKDGKLVESAKTYCEGKNLGKSNATTGAQQALLEAQAKYKKKTESGYSEDIQSIDSTGLLKPMLAKEYKDYVAKVKFPVISSPKLDGIRLNAHHAGLFSRDNKPFVSVPHIYKALRPFFEKYSEYVLDGELYNPELKNDFDKIVSLVRKSKPTPEDLEESESMVQFWVFDVFRKDGKEIHAAHVRKQMIVESMKWLNSKYIFALEHTICNSQEELDTTYSNYLDTGVEGQMINTYNALYQHKRTQDLLKRKEFQDAEFEILDVISGKGNREGCGKLIVKVGEGTCDCSLTGSVEYMREVLKDKDKYIGKTATVKFQGYTPAGSLRFPTCISIGREVYE